MQTADRVAAPRRRARWLVGGGLIVAGLGGLVAWAITTPGALNYYKTPTEILAEPADSGRTFRVGGRVADGSLSREGVSIAFRLTDGRHEVPVVYRGEVPDTLKEATDAVAEGSLRADGTLVATRVLAKCSSKFVPADSPEHLGKT